MKQLCERIEAVEDMGVQTDHAEQLLKAAKIVARIRTAMVRALGERALVRCFVCVPSVCSVIRDVFCMLTFFVQFARCVLVHVLAVCSVLSAEYGVLSAVCCMP